MKTYYHVSPLTGKASGVLGYEYGQDYIVIHFTSGAQYIYNWISCGRYHVETMKALADNQSGLNTYLTKHKPHYLAKE